MSANDRQDRPTPTTPEVDRRSIVLGGPSWRPLQRPQSFGINQITERLQSPTND